MLSSGLFFFIYYRSSFVMLHIYDNSKRMRWNRWEVFFFRERKNWKCDFPINFSEYEGLNFALLVFLDLEQSLNGQQFVYLCILPVFELVTRFKVSRYSYCTIPPVSPLVAASNQVYAYNTRLSIYQQPVCLLY